MNEITDSDALDMIDALLNAVSGANLSDTAPLRDDGSRDYGAAMAAFYETAISEIRRIVTATGRTGGSVGDLAPVCGDCCDDPTQWAEWAAMVDDLPNPADRVPCSRCGG